MAKGRHQQINKRALESLALILTNAGCPAEDALIIRDAFWQTISRTQKSAPKLYKQQSLFDI